MTKKTALSKLYSLNQPHEDCVYIKDIKVLLNDIFREYKKDEKKTLRLVDKALKQIEGLR